MPANYSLLYSNTRALSLCLSEVEATATLNSGVKLVPAIKDIIQSMLIEQCHLAPDVLASTAVVQIHIHPIVKTN